MAAYGLYTHIQSNRRRSVALMIGLFFLVYVLTYAGALVAEVLMHGDAPLDYLMRAATYDFVKAAPFATLGTVLWVLIAYKFHQSMIDLVTGAHDVTRQEEPLIIRTPGGFLEARWQYLTSFRGFVFFTKSSEPLPLPGRAEVLEAKKIWVPS